MNTATLGQGRGATLGADCTIACGTRIGHHARVCAGAVINRHVKPFVWMAGVPALQVGWMSVRVGRVQLPLAGSKSGICPHTGDCYVFDQDRLTCEPVDLSSPVS